MSQSPLRIVICGLSITSSWGNGHATTYRGLVRELAARGHDVLFLERDTYWYASNRDLPQAPYCKVRLYKSLEELKDRFTHAVSKADVVIVGSYVPQGVAVADWVVSVARGATIFYDIDTPVTLSKLKGGDDEYLSPALIPRFDLYLSFTGGPTLKYMEKKYGAQRARVLYCSVDPAVYFPEQQPAQWDIGYLGTYGEDRQPVLDRLLLAPALRLPNRTFVVAGPLYPKSIVWPDNVARIEHLAPSGHRQFYNSQKFTLNVTRGDMVRAGYSPSVRLFEAAACGTPIISDYWKGLETILTIGKEILVSRSAAETLHYLQSIKEEERIRIGERARKRILARHTAAHRAAELEGYVQSILDKPRASPVRLVPSLAEQV